MQKKQFNLKSSTSLQVSSGSFACLLRALFVSQGQGFPGVTLPGTVQSKDRGRTKAVGSGEVGEGHATRDRSASATRVHVKTNTFKARFKVHNVEGERSRSVPLRSKPPKSPKPPRRPPRTREGGAQLPARGPTPDTVIRKHHRLPVTPYSSGMRSAAGPLKHIPGGGRKV